MSVYSHNNNSLVSIIIPSYNRAGLISETLDSVINQTYESWECIIVDDGSTDGTLNIINNYVNLDNRFKFHQRDREPKGAPTCRNIGLYKSKGEFILFLDSDDILHPQFLDSQKKKIASDNFGAVIGQIYTFDRTPKISKKFSDNNYKISIDNYLKRRVKWYTSAVLWEKTELLSIDGFDEGLEMWQDWLLNVKYLAIDGKMSFNDQAIIFYRKSLSEQKISNLHKDNLKKIEVYYKSRTLAFNYLKRNNKDIRLIMPHYSLDGISKINNYKLKLVSLFHLCIGNRSIKPFFKFLFK